CLAASADGRWLASGGQDEAVILWDVARGAARRKLRQPAAPGSDLGGWQAVRGVAFCAADQALAAVGNDGGVVLWRLDGGKYVRLFPDDTGWADYCLAASADGRMLARGGHRFAAVLQEGG